MHAEKRRRARAGVISTFHPDCPSPVPLSYGATGRPITLTGQASPSLESGDVQIRLQEEPVHLKNVSELRRENNRAPLKFPPSQRPAAATLPWKVGDALSPCLAPTAPHPHRCDAPADSRGWKRKVPRRKGKVINTFRDSLRCLPSCGQEATESPESGPRVRASSLRITVTVLPATRRQ